MSLREKVDNLPTQAGVYLMKDRKGSIIYVGKAKNLRNRVRSYFREQIATAKTRALVEEVEDFDLIVTKSEVEALLLERNLIRHHQPHYNILLRDDKEYPFIRVHFGEPWPRIQKVRRRKDDGASYLGPFANPSLLHTLMKTAGRIFPLIRCSPHEFQNAKRPCNYYHMKMCMAPCTLAVDRDEYITMIKSALQILEGKNREVKEELQQKMHEAAAEERYEQAASLRDQIFAMEQIALRQVAVVKSFRNADAIGMVEHNQILVFSVTIVREHTIIGNENYVVGSAVDPEDEVVGSFLLQYYERRPVPDAIILPIELSHRDEILEILNIERDSPVKILVGRKMEAKDLVEMAKKNAQLHAEQTQSLQLRQKAELEMLQSTLNLTQLPKRIECFDISNTQEAAIVAASVCFINGKPAKEHYRRYQIQDVVSAPDDFASMREAVRRRLARGLEEDQLPDLILIDGGKGQLNAALEALAEFPQLQVPIVAIAKSRLEKASPQMSHILQRSQERLFVPGRDEPIYLETESPSYRLLTRIRDEAHRFVITFHRKKRQQLSHASALDEIPGVGPVIKKRLFERLGGWQQIQQASLEQLAAIPGVHEKLALAIYTSVRKDEQQGDAEKA
ncbi:MAG: excinuclease ABC subunit UvrC [Oligoflexus sp.]